MRAAPTVSERGFIFRWLGRRDIVIFLLLLISGLVLENAGLGLLIPLINALEGGAKPEVAIGPITIAGNIGFLITLVMSLIALRVGVTLVTVWFGSRLTNTWNERMSVQLHDALHSPIVTEPRSLKSGELVNTIIGETWSASEYCRVQLNIVSRLVALVAYGMLLIWLSWKMTISLLLIALPLALIAYRLNRRTRRISKSILELNNELYQAAVGSVGAHFTIFVYGLEQKFRSIFADKSASLRSQKVRADIYGSIVPQLLSLMVVPGVIGLGLYAKSRSIPIGEVIVFVLVLYRALPQATGVLSGLNQLARHRASFELITQRLKSWLPPQHAESHRVITNINRIEFKQVSFSFGTSDPIINEFNYTLSVGNTYRLHGASGAGKSTLVSLLLGLLTPTSGSIIMNDIPLNEVDLKSFRHQIGYAGQRTSIFEVSIQENIQLWRHLSQERIRVVEEALGVDDICAALQDGGATRIGTGGVVLSGGQQQRVAIARAIAGAPAVIILDEATSELDLAAEKRVMSAVHRLCPLSIVLAISHRVESENNGTGLWIEHCA